MPGAFRSDLILEGVIGFAEVMPGGEDTQSSTDMRVQVRNIGEGGQSTAEERRAAAMSAGIIAQQRREAGCHIEAVIDQREPSHYRG